jgi:hypothetical protein
VRIRGVLVAVGWLAVAAATAAGATAAVSAIGTSLFGPDNRSLSQRDVERQLADDPATAAPAPSATDDEPTGEPTAEPTTPPPTAHQTAPNPPPAAPKPQPRVLSTAGGTIVAQCTGGQASLISWSPAQGYRADDVDVSRGPAPTAFITFKADHGELIVAVTCHGGEPRADTATDDHRKGGGGSGGG